MSYQRLLRLRGSRMPTTTAMPTTMTRLIRTRTAAFAPISRCLNADAEARYRK